MRKDCGEHRELGRIWKDRSLATMNWCLIQRHSSNRSPKYVIYSWGRQENKGRIYPLEYFKMTKQYGILITNTWGTPDAEFCLLCLMQNKVFLAIFPHVSVKYWASVQHLLWGICYYNLVQRCTNSSPTGLAWSQICAAECICKRKSNVEEMEKSLIIAKRSFHSLFLIYMQNWGLPQTLCVVKHSLCSWKAVLGGDEIHWKPWRSGYKSLLDDF